ncbi:hypothetical protein [Cryptosporangium sp. NPDC051539]|uniref:hypothetical protein n=1 Tax=Cryptosporangium sp. NPDC051539 TaxID=3363962 RepID=UPI0037B52718
MHVGKLLRRLQPVRRPLAGPATMPADDSYLGKARAAGYGEAAVAAFEERIRGKSPEWLREHLTILDRPGPVTFKGRPLAQFDGTTCGTTSVLVARLLADPIYALSLTTDDDPEAFGRRLEAEQRRIHRTTNPAWPQRLGTSPWGARRGLAREVGRRYRLRWVDDTDENDLADTARAVSAATGPVPLLVGDLYPAHYLLVVGRTGTGLCVYDPAGGRLAEIPADPLALGDVTKFRHLHGVLLPISR